MSLKKRILVVEDNQINREMLRMILSGQYDVTEADSGQTALNLLRDRKDNIALILLDVMMPVMDGYTFLELVKQDPELALIPVIVTTQNDSEADELAALEHGATDFVPKPYRPQIILHRVASLINLRENAAMVNQLRYDRLTGLYSKEFFYKQAQEQMHTHPERQYTIICSNVENFKLYNDVFGIAAGATACSARSPRCSWSSRAAMRSAAASTPTASCSCSVRSTAPQTTITLWRPASRC